MVFNGVRAGRVCDVSVCLLLHPSPADLSYSYLMLGAGAYGPSKIKVHLSVIATPLCMCLSRYLPEMLVA